MFSSITSYLWGSSEDAEQQQEDGQSVQVTGSQLPHQPEEAEGSSSLKTRLLTDEGEDDDWLLVDTSSRDVSPHQSVRVRPVGSTANQSAVCHDSNTTNSSDSDSGPSVPSTPSLSAGAAGSPAMNRSVDKLSEPGTSGASTPVHIVYPSMEESWLVTPPPCFTAGGNSPQRMETSPLENLLIEHPSMSVYHSRGRPHSTGVESSSSDAEEVEASGPSVQPVASVRQPPHQARAVAACAGLMAQVAYTRSMQVVKQRLEARQASRNKLQRSNRAEHMASANRHPRRKHYMLRSSGRSNNRHNYRC